MKIYKMKLNEVKKAIRNPYAWPGGYPVYTLLSDGELLCPECARQNYSEIVSDTKGGINGRWSASGSMILWEGIEYCAHCYKKLDSAYSNDENEE